MTSLLQTDYKDNLLWDLTLAPKSDEYEIPRKKLREVFQKTRDNISNVLSQISIDFPHLTLHDLSHADSLWQTASVIIGNKKYPLNPLEGFVLGCAFLLHDAALSYDAFEGQDKLRDTTTWKDCFADLSKKSNNSVIEETEYKADFLAIRLLHAAGAKKLLIKLFTRSDRSSFYLIEDKSLRDHLGGLIGDIAASHHWSYEELNQLPTQKNAMAGFPLDWRINPIKLACILRCADAAHINNGRAPDYLFHLLKLNGVSYDHWKAQNYLAQIDRDSSDSSKVMITSTIDFVEEDFAAWNVAYEAVSVLNTELKATDKLLKSIDPDICFQSKEVSGADSRERLSKYILTKGWMPCEANIKISSVAELISTLGGSSLYGTDDHILFVFRELIQNARDAIKAREYFDSAFKDGEILIEINEVGGDFWISIYDNGIGMSTRTLTTSFLDFGSSFWASDLAKKEFPGLRSSSFQSVGKFGIGFYSIFMIASEVIVESRRYDEALDNTSVLKFPFGITLNPIFSKIRGLNSCISTIVRFKIDSSKYKWVGKYTIRRNHYKESDFEVPFCSVLKSLCAGLDVDVKYKGIGSENYLIHTNIEDTNLDKKQWLKDISFAEYQNDLNLLDYINKNFERLEYIRETGKIVGLAAINTIDSSHQNFLSILTIGGLTANIHRRSGTDYFGFMDCKLESAKRGESKERIASDVTIKIWALNQYLLILSEIPDIYKIRHLQYALCVFKVDPINICTVCITDIRKTTQLLTLEMLINKLQFDDKRLVIQLFDLNYCHMELHYDLEKIYYKLEINDLFFIPIGTGEFLKIEMENNVPINNLSFIDCLYRQSQLMKCSLEFSIFENYAPSRFMGESPAMFIKKK